MNIGLSIHTHTLRSNGFNILFLGQTIMTIISRFPYACMYMCAKVSCLSYMFKWQGPLQFYTMVSSMFFGCIIALCHYVRCTIWMWLIIELCTLWIYYLMFLLHHIVGEDMFVVLHNATRTSIYLDNVLYIMYNMGPLPYDTNPLCKLLVFVWDFYCSHYYF